MTFLGKTLKSARKTLAVAGLALGLSVGATTAANAEAWNFTYSGSGVTATGQIQAVWSALDNLWSVVSISGTRNGDAITGLWEETTGPNAGSCPGGVCDRDQDNNFLAGPSFGSPWWVFDQIDLHFIAGGNQYAFGYIVGYNSPTATEGPTSNLDHPYTGRCIVGTEGCVEVGAQFAQVPEINAATGLQALGILFLLGLIFRELFQRRRGNGALA